MSTAAPTEIPDPDAPMADPYAPMREVRPEATIHQRMLAILEALPAIGKSRENTEQRFMYRGHDDVMNALNPLLARFGVYFVPHVLERIPDHRTVGSGKTMYEVNLHVQFAFYGAAGDAPVIASAWGEGTDMGDKSTNKAMTHALKNVLATVFAISTAELSDADAETPEHSTRGVQSQPGPARGRSEGQAPGKRREFDPGKQLLPDAIKLDKDAWRLIGESLQEIGPTLDWKETLAPMIHERFGVLHREEVAEKDQPELARRLSNAIANLRGAVDTTAFPPPEESAPDQLVSAFRWAFATEKDMPLVVDESILEAERALAEEAAAAAAEDIPFGEDAPEPEHREHRDPADA